jgi:hypothetical protein
MQQGTVTLIVAGLGIGGTLGGIVIGHFLTRSWQHKQWLMDQRQKEFKELVDALEESLRGQASFVYMNSPTRDEEAREIRVQQAAFVKMVRTRIFTAADAKDLRLEERWNEAIDDYKSHICDLDTLRSVYESLMKDLVETATSM